MLDTESTLDTFWIPAPCFRWDKLRRNDTGGSIVKSFKRHYASLKDPSDGQETDIGIRDLTPGKRKYEWTYVRAIVSSSPEKLEGGDILWLGQRH